MGKMLEYKGYHARIEFAEEDMIFVGEVFGIQDSLNFHGTTVQELIENFHDCIDNYLELCKEKSIEMETEGYVDVTIFKFDGRLESYPWNYVKANKIIF